LITIGKEKGRKSLETDGRSKLRDKSITKKTKRKLLQTKKRRGWGKKIRFGKIHNNNSLLMLTHPGEKGEEGKSAKKGEGR